jgi:hypothetical protein
MSDNSIAHDSKWQIERRGGKEIFVTSRSGALLFRAELKPGAGMIVHAWDKKNGCEIAVRMDELLEALVTYYGNMP